MCIRDSRGEKQIDEDLERGDDYGVGKRAFRIDVRKKVLGEGQYPDDIDELEMCIRDRAVADVALGIGNVGAQFVGRLQVHIAKLTALERLYGGRGILRMHTLAGDELLRA